jgi:hypothetical protein
MAINQFVIELLPKKWVDSSNNPIQEIFSDDFYDVDKAWDSYQLTIDLASIISKFLPKSDSWHENMELYGNNEQNDVHIWKECGKIKSIKFRLDQFSKDDLIKREMIKLADILGCYLLLPEFKKIINADLNELNEQIKNSAAAKYSNDAIKFLKGKN